MAAPPKDSRQGLAQPHPSPSRAQMSRQRTEKGTEVEVEVEVAAAAAVQVDGDKFDYNIEDCRRRFQAVYPGRYFLFPMYCTVEVSTKDTLPRVFRNFVDCVCSPNASGDPLLQHLKEASCNTAQRPQDCPSGTRHLDLGRATSSVLSLSSWSMLPFFEVCVVGVYGKGALPGGRSAISTDDSLKVVASRSSMIYGEDEYIPYISVFHTFYFTRIYQGNALIGTTVQVLNLIRMLIFVDDTETILSLLREFGSYNTEKDIDFSSHAQVDESVEILFFFTLYAHPNIT
ncbi:hypothetical protein TRIUR3_34676 [Triticum urartu]|uniref:Uncharacterized protein n=1 Tax=Triticum urartu TaxID=4572 RepID=M7ZL54_TRIUA|nr:hypothetical protein TRIUR3_34676 [Triticum urartu]